ncbi:MAG: nitrate- and nitrite sensing domain-containing protein [Oceanicaulis sp.]
MSDDRLPWLGLVLLAPMVALVIVGASALTTLARTTERVNTAAAVSAFAADAAVVLEDLQIERTNAATFRMNPEMVSRQVLLERRRDTDRTIETMFARSTETSPVLGDAALDRLRASLSGLERARALGEDTGVALDPAVDAYTDVISSFLDGLADEFARSDIADPAFSTAFVMIARLQERVAIETSIGLLAFADGALMVESHPVLIEAIAPQAALTDGFKKLAGPGWGEALSATLAGADPDRLAAARAALIEAGYTDALDVSHRTFWREERLPVYFDLGVLRSRFAQEGVAGIIEEARADRAAAVRIAGLKILLLLLASGAAVFGVLRLADDPLRARRPKATPAG